MTKKGDLVHVIDPKEDLINGYGPMSVAEVKHVYTDGVLLAAFYDNLDGFGFTVGPKNIIPFKGNRAGEEDD